MKKLLTIVRITALAIIALIVGLWLLVQTSFVQNWLVKMVARSLSTNLKAHVAVGKVDFDLFNHFDLRDLLVEDQHKDTLLYVGKTGLRITDWFFVKDSITLHQLELEDVYAHIKRSDSVWNYQFLIDHFSSKDTSKPSNPIHLQLEFVHLKNIHFFQEDGWRGQDQTIQSASIDVQTDRFDLNHKKIQFREINIKRPIVKLFMYDGKRPNSLIPKPTPFVGKNSNNHLRWNTAHWDIRIQHLKIKDGRFQNLWKGQQSEPGYFDGFNIDFKEIQADARNIRWENDSIKAALVLSTQERSGFQITQLKTNLRFHPEAMEFNQLLLETPYSKIGDYFSMRFNNFDDLGSYISKVTMVGHFTKSRIHSNDIAFFAPPLRSWNRAFSFNGTIQGPVDNLRSEAFSIETGNHSSVQGRLAMLGLPDIDHTQIDFETNDLTVSYIDALAMIPSLNENKDINLAALGPIHFKGGYKGSFKEFDTYGRVETALGNIRCELHMNVASPAGTQFDGTLKTDRFQLGQLFSVGQLGHIAFDGTIQGAGTNLQTLNAQLKGTIPQLDYNGYTYTNIAVDGNTAKRRYNGHLKIDDSNIQLDLLGLIDFSQALPRFDFTADLGTAKLNSLKLTTEAIDCYGKLRCNFTGNGIDNFLGTATIYNAGIFHDGAQLPFDTLQLESSRQENYKMISLRSNEFDGALVGEFSIKDLPNAFQGFLHNYFPSYIPAGKKSTTSENFSFVLTTRNVHDYLPLIYKDLQGFNYSTFTGRLNTKENLLDLRAEVPQFNYKSVGFNNVDLHGAGSMESLGLETSIADIYINDSLHFPDTHIKMSAANDRSDLSIKTSANQTLNSANLEAVVTTRTSGVSILFKESNIDINGKNWVIKKDGRLTLTKDLVDAEGLRIFNDQQEIRITSVPSDIGNTNDLRIELEKLNAGDFMPYILPSNRIEGLVTATVDIIDPLGKMAVDVNGTAEEFRYDNDSVGKLNLAAHYATQTGKTSFKALSENNKYHFDVQGAVQTLDSTKGPMLDIAIALENTKIDMLKEYLSDVFTEVEGTATGNIRVTGPTNAPKLLGDAQVKNGKLTVGFTNVSYYIPQAAFHFTEDRMDFGSFQIKDSLGNTGMVTKGLLYHDGFSNMRFDFGLQSSKIIVLNTNAQTTDPFYGNVIAKAQLSLTGPLEDMVLDIKGQPADSSSFFIRSGDSRESGQADFIVWKTYGREMQENLEQKAGKLSINLDINANNYAKMNVIIDEYTNDVMTAIGHGNLKVNATTTGAFRITGQYDIDQGNYNFNFQSLLRKPFILLGDAGSYIRWNGDPYDAEMNVTAAFEADNVKFGDLGDRVYMQTGGDVNYIKKYRGKVKVIAFLTEKLMQPKIRFKLEMPQNSPLKNDPLVVNLLRQIENDENELNKQVAFLIIFNSFGPMSTSSQSGLTGQAVEGIVSSSISGLISKQLNKQFSSIFQKLFKDESIKVNFNAQLYNGAYLLQNVNSASAFNIDRTNLNFSLGKSMFNERLTFTFGSALDFGLTAAQAKTTNNMQFLPDIMADWKIRPDGKLLLTFFYRDSYNYQSASGKQTRSGISISLRRDFEHFSELFRKEKNRNEPPPTTVQQDSATILPKNEL